MKFGLSRFYEHGTYNQLLILSDVFPCLFTFLGMRYPFISTSFDKMRVVPPSTGKLSLQSQNYRIKALAQIL